jgi:hypothetical protein
VKRAASPESIRKSMDTLQKLYKPAGSEPVEGMTLAELDVQKAALRGALGRLEAIKTNCHHCKLFTMDVCELHGAVPVEFAKKTDALDQCPDWRYDAIPF